MYGKTAVSSGNLSAKAAVRKAAAAFRLCQACGRPTPHQEPSCTHCGKRRFHASKTDVQDQTDKRFVREFFARATPAAYGLFAFNLLVYLLMAAKAPGFFVENALRGVDEFSLAAYGAASQTALAAGEWFRLPTSVFLHRSGLHLISSSFALAVVGPQVERLYGSARFLVIYLLAGLGGTIGSLIGHQIHGRPDELAIGVSGATFGLFGVLAVFGFKYRDELPASFRQSFAVAVLPAIAVNLFIGFTVPFIDNAVHVGGLLAGVVLTLLIPSLAPRRVRLSRFNMGLLTACALVLCYCYGRAYFTHARPKPPIQQAQLSEAEAAR